jgi:hypothetical protein
MGSLGEIIRLELPNNCGDVHPAGQLVPGKLLLFAFTPSNSRSGPPHPFESIVECVFGEM